MNQFLAKGVGRSTMIVHLQDFLLKGQFGTVNFLDTPKELMEKLGQPDMRLDHTLESVLDLMYGEYCFTFLGWESGLTKISLSLALNNPFVFAFQNQQFEVNPWFFEGNQPLTFQKIQHLLHQNLIPYTLTFREFHKTPAIRLESGVLLCFEVRKSDTSTWYLDGFVLEAF